MIVEKYELYKFFVLFCKADFLVTLAILVYQTIGHCWWYCILWSCLHQFTLYLFFLYHLRRSYKVDFILLAGYLKLIPAELIQAYPKSIWNIHPSLLPAFGGKGYYGMKVHKAVIASGARCVLASAVCVHLFNFAFQIMT